MNKSIFYILFLVLSLSSCFKEKPVKPIDLSTQGKSFLAKMGADYDPQIYFNLHTAEFVSENSRYEYDLAFDCADTKFNIWLNGAKLMQSLATGKLNLSEVDAKDTLAQNWRVEYGYALPDSAALGKWGNFPESYQQVFVVKLGVGKTGENLGYKKLQIQNYSGGYNIKYANLDGSDERTAFIPKDNTKQWIFYSMTSHQIKNLEPVKDNWDLVFTVYSTYFYVERLPYTVVGILTNTTRSQAYLLDSTTAFKDVNTTNIDISRFTQKRDGVGYEWKQYELGEYIIKPTYNFIILSDNRFFKLHFLDFYEQGVKGYPKFEYEELK